MDKIADQLKKLIMLNRKISNQLQRNNADIRLLEEHFAQRENYVEKFVGLASQVDSSSLTKQQIKIFNTLFNRFEKQSQHIQKALNYITEESKARLNKAIKHTKAEKSYQLLKR